MVSEDFAINTESFTAYTTIEFQVNVFMPIAMSEFLWFLGNLNSLMFRCQLASMIVLIAFHAKMCVFCDTKKFGWFWRNLHAILA